MSFLAGRCQGRPQLFVETIVADSKGAAVGQGNVAGAVMDGLRPFHPIAEAQRQDAIAGALRCSERAGQIAVTRKDHLRFRFIGIEPHQVAKMPVIGEILPVPAPRSAVAGTGQHFRIGKLLGQDLKMAPDLTGEIEFLRPALTAESRQSHGEFLLVIRGPQVESQPNLLEVGDAVDRTNYPAPLVEGRQQQKQQQRHGPQQNHQVPTGERTATCSLG